ncbi:PAS domain S-box protein [Rhodohalobacter sp. SW132]|uniref:PAS domain-containing protein n=1 Tax=Rhodohalobacter sp. SW132 TaxID=2293433 RepID=UPI000E286E9C|nr:PAS domain S-box protein [Rhodohalobacter sp. SW132]REL38876.1 PAS domain S-box protein [Rhodohalobacter sp. SW132]
MDQHIKDAIQKYAKNQKSAEELQALFEEITAKKEQAENHLQLLENSIRSDYDSILITNLNLEKPGPEIVYVNDGFTRMTGYTREEAIGNTPRMLQGEKTDRAVLDKLKKRLKDGQSFFGHTVNYRKDGTEFINQWDIHPLTNRDGEITHWVSYQHDITERKRSEKRIVDTEVEFDKLTEESKKTLVDLDEQGNIVTSNKAFRDLTGFDEEELKKKKIWEILSDELVENFRHKFDVFKPSDFDDQTYDLEIINKKGTNIEVEAKARLLSANGQKIIRIAFQNKSLQKRILSMLSGKGEGIESMFDQARDFSYKLVPVDEGQFEFEYVTDNFSKITGITGSEINKTDLTDFIHESDIGKVINHFKVVLDGKPNTEQFRIKTKEGDYVEVIDYAKPDWDAESTSVKAIKGATSTEVSSEKRA